MYTTNTRVNNLEAENDFYMQDYKVFIGFIIKTKVPKLCNIFVVYSNF